jgi:GNAT superfamily N-acetyltransferase
MKLIQVLDTHTTKEFLEVPLWIYKDDPNFIRPLDKDINDVFDPKKNKAFRFGECTRWILKDDDENLAGRIAAFVHKKYRNKGDGQKTGGIGFFECINSQEAADMLFDVSKHWLMQRGMEAMDGPINFGERDRWWGLVIEGFKPPIYLMNYNRPYYKDLFENYGFKIFFKQICWHISLMADISDKLLSQYNRYKNNPDYVVGHVRKNNLKKFAEDFCEVYNKAWAKHEGNKLMSKEVAYKMFKSMKMVMDENLVWFVYHKGVPVAFWVNLPELNQIFKRFNGKFRLIEKIRLLWLRYQGACDKFTGIVFGVVPEYQGMGIDYFMIVAATYNIRKKTAYKELELQWQGDFNPRILNISKSIGAEHSRILATYRYLFDRTKEFKRHPILN